MRTVKIDLGTALDALSKIPEDVPIVMLNLLRFKEHADYGDRPNVVPCSGREAFQQRYAQIIAPLMAADDSRLFWAGIVLAYVVAPADELWDDVALVEYPSVGAFRRLIEDPRYQSEAAFHRTAALEDSRLIAMVKMS